MATTFETDNPFATPATEIRIAPLEHFYLKAMVMAGDPSPMTSNPTGLVPTFRGSPVIVSEIGFTPGRKATSPPVDDAESRKGYSGLYQFGAAYNPGAFTAPLSPTPVSGNFLLYWKASQALWRAMGARFRRFALWRDAVDRNLGLIDRERPTHSDLRAELVQLYARFTVEL